MVYKINNIHRYYRTRSQDDGHGHGHEDSPPEPVRHDTSAAGADTPCAIDKDPEGEIASILHKKCAVITLAEQQWHRLLDNGADQSLNRSSRLMFACYYKCRYILADGYFKIIALLLAMVSTFLFGLLIGSASCGTYLGNFNSPLLNCINSKFIQNDYLDIDNVFIGIA